MTYPNSSPDHQSEQTPDCWEELTAEEREIWQSLTHDERRAFPPSCALNVIRRALANRWTSTKSASSTEQDQAKERPPARSEETDQQRLKHKQDQAKERPINPAVPSTVIQTTAQALDQAEETAGILSELARLCWRVNHREECPQEQIPTLSELGQWLREAPAGARDQANQRLNELVEILARTVEFDNLDPFKDRDFRWQWMALSSAPILFAAFAHHDPTCHTVVLKGDLTLGEVQALWRRIPRADLPHHPLAPIVAAWQEKPTPIEPDRNAKPIIGKAFTTRLDRTTPHAPALDVVDVPGLVPYRADLFAPAEGDTPSLVKTLYNAAGEIPTRQGRAPLAAVLWLEGLLSIPTQYRDGHLHSMQFTRRELYEHWAGCDPRHWRTREADRQDLALGRMANTRITVGEGWYVPLIVQATEGPHLNSRVSVLVRLPEETQQGPSVPRRILRKLLTSKLAWLGFINICVHLDRYGGRKGHLIAATRPEVKRNEQSQILDHKGEVIRNRRGYPIDRYTDPRAIHTGKREPNPARTQYPALGKDERIALFYPLDPPTSPQDERDKWKATKRALRRIEREGGLVIEKVRDGWRIMPGAWAFAKHNPI